MAPPQLPLDGGPDAPNLAPVSVGIVDFPEDVTAFELADLDAVGATRRLLQAGAAPATDARARAELADLAQRHSGLHELSLPLLTGSTGPVAPLVGGVRLATLAQLRPEALRRSALAAEHEAAGARLVPAGGGWLDVAHHGEVEAEEVALRLSVGVRDAGTTGLFRLDGPAASSVLAAALGKPAAARLAALEVGELVVVATPHASAPVVVARPAEATWLLRTEPADTDAVDERLVAARFDGPDSASVHVSSVGESLPGIVLAGPLAEPCLVELAGPAPAPGTVASLVEGSSFELGLLWCYTVAGRDLFELRVPAGRAAAAWRAVVSVARDRQGRPVGALAWESVAASRTAGGVVAGG
ncbi:MAG: hypothetical protein GEV08_16230 [Acidimicrobiia bacterium]|nr:hypothetical protein [Acidimicrobiia bacterium]